MPLVRYFIPVVWAFDATVNWTDRKVREVLSALITVPALSAKAVFSGKKQKTQLNKSTNKSDMVIRFCKTSTPFIGYN
ncbi:MAG: hypothetical protein PHG06_06795 [Parabacteroides sp.]|nr:hypothetical protein [Parabacteroides sp.]